MTIERYNPDTGEEWSSMGTTRKVPEHLKTQEQKEADERNRTSGNISRGSQTMNFSDRW